MIVADIWSIDSRTCCHSLQTYSYTWRQLWRATQTPVLYNGWDQWLRINQQCLQGNSSSTYKCKEQSEHDSNACFQSTHSRLHAVNTVCTARAHTDRTHTNTDAYYIYVHTYTTCSHTCTNSVYHTYTYSKDTHHPHTCMHTHPLHPICPQS